VRALAAVVLGLVAVVAAAWCLSATAGNYSPPAGDGRVHWLSNSLIVFTGADPAAGAYGGIRSVDVDASPPIGRTVVDHALGLSVSPDRKLLAFQVDGPHYPLVVSAADGTQQRTVAASGGALIGWLPDSSRLIFATVGGSGDSTYYSIRPDGTDLIKYPANVDGFPSPDASHFVYATTTNSGSRVHVVNADGSDDRVVWSGGGLDLPPNTWSPQGTYFAFRPDQHSLVVVPVAGEQHTFSVTARGSNGQIAWSADGHTIYAIGTAGLVGIDPSTGARHTVPGIPPLSNPSFSPDGTRIAYTKGGECRDRVGIYVARADGTGARRVSNSCRVIGTDGSDVLHGSFSQVVLGLAGNDTLFADDPGYFLQGNTLYGGPGADILYGGYGQDILYGGPGNDTLDGGPSIDIINGGPGNDHIDGGGGNDTIGARDHQRDWISCGTTAPRTLRGTGEDERDVVYADKEDIVAHDCEIIRRR